MSETEFKIEKGIPAPKQTRGRKAAWQELLEMMEVNDSVLLPTRSQVSSLQQAAKRRGMKIVSKIDTHREQFRAWRVE